MTNDHDELTAADAMQMAVKTVPPSMPLAELEQQLIEEKISGYPVVEEDKLVGVVSRSDVVRQICTERYVARHVSDFFFDETGFHEVPAESLKDIADRVGERLEELTVADVMVRDPYTVSQDHPLSHVARSLVQHGIHRLPVVDRGRLVGIVTTTDLVRLIAHKRLRSVR